MPGPSPVNEIFERKVASSCCYEYPVKNKNEIQGAKQVLTKKHKMVSIPYVLEMYGLIDLMSRIKKPYLPCIDQVS